MRLENIEIRNYRGHESLDVVFHPEVTLLVGANGAGKTSILEAIVQVLAPAMAADKGEYRHFATTDVRIGGDRVDLVLRLEYGGQRGTLAAHYEPERDASGQFAGWSSDSGGDALFDYPSQRSDSEPIAAYYGIERHVRDSTPGSRDAVYRTPRDAWRDAWTATAGFGEFFRWFREREDIENAERVEHSAFRDPQLSAVRQAIETLLPGYARPRIRRPRGAVLLQLNRPSLVITKGEQDLAFDQLSGGERTLAALAGDIARRLAIANPKADDPRQGRGVVLIDEVDLHLHPVWQSKVIDALRRTFPNVQLVLTTHSLVVPAYVPSDCVRLLQADDGLVLSPPTEGRDPNSLARETFGVPLRPPWIREKLDAIAADIDAEDFERARAMLGELSETLSATDTDIVRLQTTLDLEDF